MNLLKNEELGLVFILMYLLFYIIYYNFMTLSSLSANVTIVNISQPILDRMKSKAITLIYCSIF